MQRGGLDALGASLAQTVQMPLRRRKFGGSQRRLLGEQLLCFIDIVRHEHAESDPQTIRNPLVERRQLFGAFRRELETVLNLSFCKFTEVLVDDVTDVFSISGLLQEAEEHRAPS